MGLDMYLEGVLESSRVVELGYWRKHPNLHGYIVKTFAQGIDECQKIPLTANDLQNILTASEENRLPFTTGFFFGVSDPEHKQETKEILTNAIAWLKENPNRTLYYQASW